MLMGVYKDRTEKAYKQSKTKIKKLTINIFTAEYNVYCKRSLPLFEILTVQFEFSFSGYY